MQRILSLGSKRVHSVCSIFARSIAPATVQRRIRIVSCFNLHDPHLRTARRTHPGVAAINPRPINQRATARSFFHHPHHCPSSLFPLVSLSFPLRTRAAIDLRRGPRPALPPKLKPFLFQFFSLPNFPIFNFLSILEFPDNLILEVSNLGFFQLPKY